MEHHPLIPSPIDTTNFSNSLVDTVAHALVVRIIFAVLSIRLFTPLSYHTAYIVRICVLSALLYTVFFINIGLFVVHHDRLHHLTDARGRGNMTHFTGDTGDAWWHDARRARINNRLGHPQTWLRCQILFSEALSCTARLLKQVVSHQTGTAWSSIPRGFGI